MKKLGVIISALVIAAGFSGCATLTTDEAAKLVSMSLQGSTSATGSGTFGSKSASDGLRTEEIVTVVTNSEGVITTTYDYLVIKFIKTYRGPTYSENWINQIFGISYIASTNSFGIYSDISFRFLYSNETVIPLANDVDLANLSALDNGGGVQVYGLITFDATNGEGAYHLSGNFGASKSDPFTIFYANGTGKVDGTMTFNAATPDLDNVVVVIDFQNLTMSTNNYTIEYDKIVFVPVGTVSGSVTYSRTVIPYTITCDGTTTGQMTIGAKEYTVDWLTGVATPVES